MSDMGNGCASCIHEAEIQELKRDSERNSQAHREFYNKFAEQGKAIAISEERYNNLLQLITEIKTSVNELKDKPSKKWDNMSSYVATSVIGLILGYVASLIF